MPAPAADAAGPPPAPAPAEVPAPAGPAVGPAAPAPAPVRPPDAAGPEVAALGAAGLPPAGGALERIQFSGAETLLTPEAEGALRSVAVLISATDRRIQLNAYAGGTAETVGAARRLSLSRALTVRSFLIEAGVRSTRIDIRALGIAEDPGPPERVDIILLAL